ncbi:MAG: hypothetical protein ACOXZ4_04825 [Sphaerochaetaceae bacterium]
MKTPQIKVVYLVSHSLVTLLLLFASLHALFWRHGNGMLFPFAAIAHMLISYVGLFPSLKLPDTSRNEIERHLLPLLFLSLTLINAFVAIELTSRYINPSFWAKVHLFALIFSMLLLLLLGLFRTGINAGRLFQYTFTALLLSLLLAAMIPLSVPLNPFEPSVWMRQEKVYLIVLLLGLLALASFSFLLAREKDQYSRLRNISFCCIVLGNILYGSRLSLASVWAGVVLYAVGLVLGIPHQRFSQLQ